MKKRELILNKITHDYPNNSIDTSKYNCLTFIPKNMIE